MNQRPYDPPRFHFPVHRFHPAEEDDDAAAPLPELVPSAVWRVVVAESDPDDAERLVRGLRMQGHRVRRADNGRAAIKLCTEADLILLDLELPDIDGLEVCRVIRRKWHLPIITVAARASTLDRVLALQAGADDYVVKPCGLRELTARMEAVMRRVSAGPGGGRSVSHGPLIIDAKLRKVSLHGRIVTMTRKEFDLLYLLASDPETVVPRQRLMEKVWGSSWSSRTLDTHVSSIRRKLGANGWIVTVRGFGFQLGHD